jgi:hypothetical protein
MTPGRPSFDALNACLYRACQDACFELVEKLREGPFDALKLAQGRPFTVCLSSPYLRKSVFICG